MILFLFLKSIHMRWIYIVYLTVWYVFVLGLYFQRLYMRYSFKKIVYIEFATSRIFRVCNATSRIFRVCNEPYIESLKTNQKFGTSTGMPQWRTSARRRDGRPVNAADIPCPHRTSVSASLTPNADVADGRPARRSDANWDVRRCWCSKRCHIFLFGKSVSHININITFSLSTYYIN